MDVTPAFAPKRRDTILDLSQSDKKSNGIKGGKGLRDGKGGASYTLERGGRWNGFSRGFLADEHFLLSASGIFADL